MEIDHINAYKMFDTMAFDDRHQGPLLLTWFNLIPAWKSNLMHSKVWDGITFPFLNVNGATVEV